MNIENPKKPAIKKVSFALISFLATSLGLYALVQYSSGSASGFLKMKEGMQLPNYWVSILIVHALGGGIALATGWLQFVERFRQRYIFLHRCLGTLFYIAAFTGAIAGLYVAHYASGGIIAQSGFTAVALIWLGSLSMSLRRIWQRDFNGHEVWAYRVYAITFAAVTLRLYTSIIAIVWGTDRVMDFYGAIAWFCWMPNILFVELFLRYSKIPRLRRLNLVQE